MKVYFDGVSKGLLDDNFNPQNGIMAVVLMESGNNVVGNIGKQVSSRIITRAVDMTTNFSAGAVDPFGDPTP
ncbi:MAG: hypothetical protein ACLGG0_12725 [Bacteriovoracia bacterium]